MMMLAASPSDTSFKDRYVEDFLWDPASWFFIDVGSIFYPSNRLDGFLEVEDAILKQIDSLCRSGWLWTLDEINNLAHDQHGYTVVMDVTRRLWIYFDSKQDAMLSRITLVDLRNAKHADGGRRPDGVESANQ